MLHNTFDKWFHLWNIVAKNKRLIGKIVEEANVVYQAMEGDVQCITSNKSFQLEVLSIVFLLVCINP
jgi:hypothetical protein